MREPRRIPREDHKLFKAFVLNDKFLWFESTSSGRRVVDRVSSCRCHRKFVPPYNLSSPGNLARGRATIFLAGGGGGDIFPVTPALHNFSLQRRRLASAVIHFVNVIMHISLRENNEELDLQTKQCQNLFNNYVTSSRFL